MGGVSHEQQQKIGSFLRSWKTKIRRCMAGRCKTCNMGFNTRRGRLKHYESSGWHYYNRTRKEAGRPPVTLFQFLSTPSPLLFVCRPCEKGFRTLKPYVQHLESIDHANLVLMSQGCL